MALSNLAPAVQECIGYYLQRADLTRSGNATICVGSKPLPHNDAVVMAANEALTIDVTANDSRGMMHDVYLNPVIKRNGTYGRARTANGGDSVVASVTDADGKVVYTPNTDFIGTNICIL